MMKLRSNVGVLLLYLLAAVLVVYSLSLVFLSNFNMGNLMVWLLTGCVTGYAVFRRPVNAWFSAGIGRVVFGVLAVLVCLYLAVIAFVAVSGYLPPPTGNEQVVIVLGAGLHRDKPSKLLQYRLDKAYAFAAAHPDTINTIRTYCYGTGDEMRIVPEKDGKTDLDALREMLTTDVASFYVQQPNFFGLFEDAEALGQAVHQAGARYIMGCNPIALAVMKTPRDCGADIAVGEGQPLGMPLSFGGPYLGFMTCKKAMMRKLPGRIVGETKDDDGNRCFVLTLQAREQHIRREKASSNICSNEQLCALTVAVYLAAMGPKGLRQAAESSAAHAHYLAGELAKLGFGLRSGDKPFFHEFLTDSPIEPETLCAKLEEQGILGGLPVDGGILWCCTECNSKAEIDRLIKVIGEVLA